MSKLDTPEKRERHRLHEAARRASRTPEEHEAVKAKLRAEYQFKHSIGPRCRMPVAEHKARQNAAAKERYKKRTPEWKLTERQRYRRWYKTLTPEQKAELMQRSKAWAAANKARLREAERLRRRKPEAREKQKLSMRRYRSTEHGHARSLAAQRVHTKRHPEKIRAANRAYYATPEGRAVRDKWRADNKDRVQHTSRVRQVKKRYRTDHPDLVEVVRLRAAIRKLLRKNKGD